MNDAPSIVAPQGDLSRRSALRFLALGGAVVLWPAIAPPSARAFTIPPGDRIAFSVFRKGDSPMGYHRVKISRQDDLVVMEKEIFLEVKLAFVTAYEYKHTNREIWKDGRLIAIETKTNNDGDKEWIKGEAVEGGFRVEGRRGVTMAPPDIIPSSYWNIATVQAVQMLDTQRGLVMDVRVDALGEETIEAAGQKIGARHHAINIFTNLPGGANRIDLWYDRHDAWVALAFKAKGQAINYVLDPGGLIPQPDPTREPQPSSANLSPHLR
jgi:Family of unknown function (DUF6134)